MSLTDQAIKQVDKKTYRARIFDPQSKAQQSEMESLIQSSANIVIHDEIESQIHELVKLRNPRKQFSIVELEEEEEKLLGGFKRDLYGNWVFYPWLNKLVHLLKEPEFVETRTNRNLYKITKEEQKELSQKKVGIIGLSVGQSIALTLAMERSICELRIADFDTLELSNMNRIRTGVHNLGLSKVVIAAREIAEIDPYIKVTCFEEGVNDDNMEHFLNKGGRLDLLIDECDSIDVKILCRIEAKKNQIPVVMETNDRGMIDIERFDLEPERSILHGLVDHLDLEQVRNAKTSQEKAPFITAIVDLDNMSERLKSSWSEIGKSIMSWPQLASSVIMGGGTTADIARRILLGQSRKSGRYYIDLEKLIPR